MSEKIKDPLKSKDLVKVARAKQTWNQFPDSRSKGKESTLLLKAAVYVKHKMLQFTEGRGCAVPYEGHSLATRVTEHLKMRPVHTERCWRQMLGLDDLVQGKEGK